MKNEMVLDGFDVQELSFGEVENVDGGMIILIGNLKEKYEFMRDFVNGFARGMTECKCNLM